MKKILVLCAVATLAAACYQNTRTADDEMLYDVNAPKSEQAKAAKYQIIDQEFDNLLAPDSDYETLSAQELQSCGSGYVPPTTKLKEPKAPTVDKAAVAKKVVSEQVTTKKKVINNTNIYYMDGPAPAAPAQTSSTSTTTTYTTSSSY